MASASAPLTRERVVAAAADVVRRYGPTKANVVDVARVLGVSHAAVYRHVATKAELRDLVVRHWMDAIMAPLRAVAGSAGAPAERLRAFFDSLIAIKRRRAADDPELFLAYRTLAADAKPTVAEHLDELVALVAAIIREGIEAGTLRAVDPVRAARAVLFATSRFHHPAHVAEWLEPGLDDAYEAVWQILMTGLAVPQPPAALPEAELT